MLSNTELEKVQCEGAVIGHHRIGYRWPLIRRRPHSSEGLLGVLLLSFQFSLFLGRVQCCLLFFLLALVLASFVSHVANSFVANSSHLTEAHRSVCTC